MTISQLNDWQLVCSRDDLVADSGVCVLVDKQQIAIFYLPQETPCIYALENLDPVGRVNVLSRGIVGDVDGRLVVSSPLFKQHFDLGNGECLEDTECAVRVFPVHLEGEQVLIDRPF